MKKILLLGSGELGKELTISLQRLGCVVIACDKYPNAPAMHVSNYKEVFNMLDKNKLEQIVLKYKPDLIVPEVEAINTEKLFEFENKGIVVIPSARAVNLTMNRDLIRDRAQELNIKTARFGYANTKRELIQIAKSINGKVAIKPVMSSSGKGQSYARTEQELSIAWDVAIKGMRGNKKKVIIEEFIDFKLEVTLLTVIDSEGKFHYCPPIGHYQKRGDYQNSWQPADCENNLVTKMKKISKKIISDLGGTGLFGVEFFIKKNNDIIFSELSPRPHDTGLVTLFTQNFSEFDLHARALLSLPIPKIRLTRKGVSQVILAGKKSNGDYKIYGIRDALKYKENDLRIFGKPKTKPYRRMGVIFSDSLKQAKLSLKHITIKDL